MIPAELQAHMNDVAHKLGRLDQYNTLDMYKAVHWSVSAPGYIDLHAPTDMQPLHRNRFIVSLQELLPVWLIVRWVL